MASSPLELPSRSAVKRMATHHEARQRLSVEAAQRTEIGDEAPPIQTYARADLLGDRVASKLIASDLLHKEALEAGAGAALDVLCQREKPMLSALAPVQACTQREGG